MASATRDRDESEGVVFIHEADGSIAAKDIGTGVASFGDTTSEALRTLAGALELHEGGGEPVTDADLRGWGLDPDGFDTTELPEFMR